MWFLRGGWMTKVRTFKQLGNHILDFFEEEPKKIEIKQKKIYCPYYEQQEYEREKLSEFGYMVCGLFTFIGIIILLSVKESRHIIFIILIILSALMFLSGMFKRKNKKGDKEWCSTVYTATETPNITKIKIDDDVVFVVQQVWWGGEKMKERIEALEKKQLNSMNREIGVCHICKKTELEPDRKTICKSCYGEVMKGVSVDRVKNMKRCMICGKGTWKQICAGCKKVN